MKSFAISEDFSNLTEIRARSRGVAESDSVILRALYSFFLKRYQSFSFNSAAEMSYPSSTPQSTNVISFAGLPRFENIPEIS